jgi:hypothetical protein
VWGIVGATRRKEKHQLKKSQSKAPSIYIELDAVLQRALIT